MSPLRQGLRDMRPNVILALGSAAFAIYAYPGLMTRDSYEQLREVRDRAFSDAQPPMTQAIWSVLDYVVAGPFPLIVLQTTMFVAGVVLVLRRVLTRRAAALAAVGVLWFPPVGAVMAVAAKEGLMAGLTMFGIALLFDARRRMRVVALAVLCVAAATRYHGFAATLPPIVLLFVWRDGAAGWRRYVLATAIWAVATLTAFGASSLLTDKPVYSWRASFDAHDMVDLLQLDGRPGQPIATHANQNPAAQRQLGIATSSSAYQRLVDAGYEWGSQTWLFRPFVYLLLTLALAALAIRQPDVLAILASGLLVELSLGFLGSSADYHHSHWLVVTACVGLVIVVARRYRERHDHAIARRGE